MAKLTLDLPLDFDFAVLGLTCGLRSHRVAWQLNDLLGLSFEAAEDWAVEGKSGQSFFLHYEYQTEASLWRLWRNRSVDGQGDRPAHLLPEAKQYDYLLLLEGEEIQDQLGTYLSKVKTLPDLQWAQSLDLDDLPSKANLLA